MLQLSQATENQTTPPNLQSDFIAAAKHTHQELSRQNDLSPANDKVNRCLSDFVNAVLNFSVEQDAAKVLETEEIQNLRPELLSYLSRAEFEMETYFAKIFAQMPVIEEKDLDLFWYKQCYQDLVDAEIEQLDTLDISPDAEIAFVGSGPLPLTAIEYYLQTGNKMTCFDTDAEAVRLSRQMIQNMGLSDVIEVRHQAGEDADYSQFDVVMVASLVKDKEKTLDRIRTTAPDAKVAVRSVEGVKAMLYEVVNKDDFEAHSLKYAGSTKDDPATINTTLFFRPA
ncbi:MAG: nicotianamine synthase [Alphaproteobacteria bacterium]|nr:nicotianamine synthase [Alphaproteobacteria bacterium]|tara:strand:- start:6 stop:854 length:849 start_codon:yes stop_codon:yes gene_type:complete